MDKTPETLNAVGRLLYGSGWANQMATALGVNIRTLQRWRNGQNPIAPGVWSDLARLCEGRAVLLESVTNQLRV